MFHAKHRCGCWMSSILHWLIDWLRAWSNSDHLKNWRFQAGKNTSLLRCYHRIFQSTNKNMFHPWILIFRAKTRWKHRSRFPGFSRNMYIPQDEHICYLFQDSTHSTNLHLFKWKKQPCPRNCTPNSTSIHPKKTPQNRRFFSNPSMTSQV